MMRMMTHTLSLLVAGLAISMIPVSGKAQTTTKSLTKITQALPAKDINFLPWYIAQEQGYFATEGLEVALPTMTSQVAIPALLTKQVEFSNSGSSARAAYQGAAVRVVMYAYNNFPLMGVAAKGIEAFKDLSGKVFAISAVGGSDDMITRALAQRYKIVDYKSIALGRPTARAAALSSAQAHFTLIDPLSAFELERKGFKLMGEAGDVRPLPSAGFAVHLDTLTERRDVVRAWMRASLRSLMFIKKSRSQAAEIAARLLDIDKDLALKSLNEIAQYIDEDDPGGVSLDLLVRITTDDFAELKLAGDPKAMAEKIADFSILREAQRDLGIQCKHGYQCK